ncbi:MAG: CTP-dependent riboflavin kinase [Methanobacteriaceae archaeon]|jgi:riboflavin kinase|nr:CTP-dependent riboflavin kinase [Methanobacteriaceae archaeon]
METDGFVTSGYGKGKEFLSKDFYKLKFKEKLGFKPYPGTLNIIIPEKHLKDINSIKKNCKNKINGENNFGSVKYIEATLNNKIKGAIVFPEKTTHDENYLEFISQEGLREKLYLKDDDKVNLIIGD